MPTLKAIHICNSLQPLHKPKIAKEYVFANAERRTERKKPAENNGNRCTRGLKSVQKR